MRATTLTLLFALFSSCTVSSSTSCASDGGTDLSYASFGQAFMTQYCTACHGSARAENGIRLDTLAKVQAYKSAVIAESGTRTSMPPSGSTAPSSSERALLTEWLSCGAQ